MKFANKKAILITIVVLLIGTTFGVVPEKVWAETAWNAMPSTGFDAQVNGVSAVSEIAVWAVGDDNDASGQLSFFDGWDWSEQTIPTTQELNDISMASSTAGVAVGDTDATRGAIIYTTDGGTNWTQSTDADIPLVNMNGVCMASATVGWAVGDLDGGTGDETLLYTSDGGVNWADQGAATGSDPNLNDVDAASTTVATVAGESDGAKGMIRYTANAGTLWTQQVNINIPNCGLNGVYMASTSTAYVVGDINPGGGGEGTLLKSITLPIDTWTISGDVDISTENLHGVDGTSTTRVWVSGESDSIIETSDGTDWVGNVAPANSDTIRRLSAEDNYHIYGACSSTNYVIASFDITAHDVQFDLGVGISVELDSTAAYDFGTVIPEVVYTSAANVRNVTVKTNNVAGWILYIKGTGAFEDTSSNTVNLNVLEWSEDAAAWTDTTTIDTQVASNGAATGAAGVTTGMEYRINVVPYGVTTDGTDFVTTLTYTAVTQ